MDLDGAFEWVGPDMETFLGPEMATSVASAIWAQKSWDFRAHPSNAPRNGFPPIQIHTSSPISTRTTGTLVIFWTRDKRFQGENKRSGGVGGGESGGGDRCVMHAPVPVPSTLPPTSIPLILPLQLLTLPPLHPFNSLHPPSLQNNLEIDRDL
jgi:hypothetical protein